ncbi:MAG: hypothetical protein HYU63_06790 [Armatimonadetes bacterium]|nr:hypothetical protein [Armatimonadota bacterium]
MKNKFLFGPGTIIAIIIGIFLIFKNYLVPHSNLRPKVLPAPLILEVSFLINQKEKLNLNSNQLSYLSDLEKKYKKENFPVNKELSEGAKKFTLLMNEKKGKVSKDELFQKMQPVSALSFKLSRLRNSYWNKALIILTAKQKIKLKEILNEKI